MEEQVTVISLLCISRKELEKQTTKKSSDTLCSMGVDDILMPSILNVSFYAVKATNNNQF